MHTTLRKNHKWIQAGFMFCDWLTLQLFLHHLSKLWSETPRRHCLKSASRIKMTAAKVFFLLAVYLQGGFTTERNKSFSKCKEGEGSFYDFSIKDIYGLKVPDTDYKNHVALVMNVATFWGLTMQYKQLNELLQTYRSEENGNCGFRVLAFPCNQFGLQEPGENAYEILNGLKYVRPGHGFELDRNLKMMQKIEVNGKKESKIFTFLKVSQSLASLWLFLEGFDELYRAVINY